MVNFRKIKDNLLSLFFPDRCSVCGEVTDIGKAVCDECSRDIFAISGKICHKCGASLSDHDEAFCSEISAPVIGAFYYRGAVRNLIIDFKDTKQMKYFEIFSLTLFEKIAQEYCDIDFDIAVCVPSFGSKKSTSEIIAREAAKRFMLSFDREALEKYRQTEKQHRLSGDERLRNLENSIRVREGKSSVISGKTVLLCDDVKTTGTTLNECVKALYESGAKAVYCACIAVSDYGVR